MPAPKLDSKNPSQEDVDRFITATAIKYGFDNPLMLLAIQRVESPGGHAKTVSSAGATGLMQVMPSSFKALQRQGRIKANADITDPEVNVHASIELLKDNFRYAGGDPEKALAGYNGGMAAIKKYRAELHDELPAETKQYPGKVMKKYQEITGADKAGMSREAARTTGTVEPATQQQLPVQVADTINSEAGMFSSLRQVFNSMFGGTSGNQ